jgi:hypothetical protein
MRQRHNFVPDATFELHELVDHGQGLCEFRYFRIPLSLQMLHYLLEMGMSSIDLTLNNVGTFFEIGKPCRRRWTNCCMLMLERTMQ